MKTLIITESNIEKSYAVLLHHCHQVGQHNQLVSSGRWAQSTDFCFWEWDQIELLNKNIFIRGNEDMKKASLPIALSLGMVETDCEEEAHFVFVYEQPLQMSGEGGIPL